MRFIKNDHYYGLLILSFSFPSCLSYASSSLGDEQTSIQPLVGGFIGYHGIGNGNKLEGDFNYSLAGGLRFNPNWSWMLKYQYSDDSNFDTSLYDVDLGIVSNTLRYEWYIKPDVSIMAGLGTAYWQQDSHSGGKASGWSPVGTYGINAYYAPNFSFQAAYQYIYDIGESKRDTIYDLHNIVLGIVYQYGQGKTAAVPPPQPRPIVDIEKVSAPEIPVSDFHETFHFGFDSIIIIESVEAFVQALNVELSKYPDAKIKIVGHTDSVGTDAYNKKLSVSRGYTLLDILQAHGINGQKVKVIGEGSQSPIASNTTVEGRALNRRVTLELILD